MNTPIPDQKPRLRRPLSWLVLLVAISAATTAAVWLVNRLLSPYVLEVKQQRTLVVLTWNIGKLHLQWDSRAADRDLQYVAKVVRESSAQVVALQELRSAEQLNKLLAFLGPPWIGAIPNDVYDRRAAIISRLPAEFVGLSTSSGRTAQGAIVSLPEGLRLVVASLHLDAFDAQRRVEQAEEIFTDVHRLEIPDFVLAGDFNFDAAVAARGDIDHRLYRFLTQEMTDAAKDVGATSIFSRRVDYIFVHSQRVAHTRARLLRERRINNMDHDPVLVELNFTAGK